MTETVPATRDCGADLAVAARGLRKAYGDVVAVAGIDIAVERGICLGLLGPNGAGKTTTLEILEGLLVPDAGEVTVLGRTWREHGRALRAAIGVQLQETRFSDKMKVREILRLFRSFYTDGRSVAEVLALVGLADKRSSFHEHLSGGQRQRLALGCALVSRPQLLFLDEPTTGLDPQARRRVWEIIEEFKGSGGTVIFSTHYMDEAERLADRLVIIDHGRIIAEGTPRTLLAAMDAKAIVEFLPADGSLAVDVHALERLPGVHATRTIGEHFSITVDEVHTSLPAILGALRVQGIELRDLRTHRANLEDLFVLLTGRQLRDE